MYSTFSVVIEHNHWISESRNGPLKDRSVDKVFDRIKTDKEYPKVHSNPELYAKITVGKYSFQLFPSVSCSFDICG